MKQQTDNADKDIESNGHLLKGLATSSAHYHSRPHSELVKISTTLTTTEYSRSGLFQRFRKTLGNLHDYPSGNVTELNQLS